MTTRANRQVVQDLENKLRLERTFRPEVKSIFSRMMKSFAAVVARTGRAPDAQIFKATWDAALRKHYDRTQKMFSGTVRNFQGKFLPVWDLKQEEDEDQTLFLFALQKWTDDNAPEVAEKTTETNQKNYQQSINQAEKTLREGGEPFGNRDLALTAVAFLRRKFGGRVETITSFNTQAPAEATKLIEAEVTVGVEPFSLRPLAILPIVTATKTWRTRGDKLVRDIHKAVNFQKRVINIPFNVNGQQLMTPGDTSLGATMDNVAGCRCSAIYEL